MYASGAHLVTRQTRAHPLLRPVPSGGPTLGGGREGLCRSARPGLEDRPVFASEVESNPNDQDTSGFWFALE